MKSTKHSKHLSIKEMTKNQINYNCILRILTIASDTNDLTILTIASGGFFLLNIFNFS